MLVTALRGAIVSTGKIHCVSWAITDMVRVSYIDKAGRWAKTVETGPNASLFNGVSVAPDGSVYAGGYIHPPP